jgi:hypothetical protein
MAKSYSELAAEYETLTDSIAEPIGRATLLNTLNRLETAGTAAAQSDELGTVRYANEMTARYKGALALNSQGVIHPPFTTEMQTSMQSKIDSLSIFTVANTDSVTADGPTDPDTIPTDDAKNRAS